MPPRRKTPKTTTNKKHSRAAAEESRPPPTLTSLSAETLLRIAKLLAGNPLDVFHLMLTCKTCLEPARRALPADRSLLKKPRPVIELDDEEDESEDEDEEEEEEEEEEEQVNSEEEAYERRVGRHRPRWRIRLVEHNEEEEEAEYEVRLEQQAVRDRLQRRAVLAANPARQQLLEAARQLAPDMSSSSDDDEDEEEYGTSEGEEQE